VAPNFSRFPQLFVANVDATTGSGVSDMLISMLALDFWFESTEHSITMKMHPSFACFMTVQNCSLQLPRHHSASVP